MDDVFTVGQPNVVTACMKFIGPTKLTGFISREEGKPLRDGDFSLERIPKLNFIGLQIKFDKSGAVISSTTMDLE